MEKEFNLSEKRTEDILGEWSYEEKDVKEFIRLLKEDERFGDYHKWKINKLAGDELIK